MSPEQELIAAKARIVYLERRVEGLTAERDAAVRGMHEVEKAAMAQMKRINDQLKKVNEAAERILRPS